MRRTAGQSAAVIGSTVVRASRAVSATLGHDRTAERTEAVDTQDHLVARLQVAAERRIADLEEAAGPDGAAAEEVTGAEPRIGRRARKHLAEREPCVRPATAAG